MRPSRTAPARRRGFTAIEVIAVLFLAALLTSLTALSLRGIVRPAELDDVADRLGVCDAMVRASARQNHRPTRLTFDASRGDVGETRVGSSGETTRSVCRLPEGWRMERMLAAHGREGFGTLEVPISARGLSPAYAVLLARGDDKRWVVVSGMTGSAGRARDEQEAEDKLNAVAGDDAH